MGDGQDLHSRPSSAYRSSFGEGSAQGRGPVLDGGSARPDQRVPRPQDHRGRRHDVVRVRVRRARPRLAPIRHQLPRRGRACLVDQSDVPAAGPPEHHHRRPERAERRLRCARERPLTRMPTRCFTPPSKSRSTWRLKTARSVRSCRRCKPFDRESHRSPCIALHTRYSAPHLPLGARRTAPDRAFCIPARSCQLLKLLLLRVGPPAEPAEA